MTELPTRFRDWTNRYSAPVTVLCLVVLLLCGATLFWSKSASSVPIEHQAWYRDSVTGETFMAAEQLPPIVSPAGNPSARVYYYGCGACGDDDRFVGYYYKLSDGAMRRIAENPQLEAAAWGPRFPGRMYSLDGETWVEAPDPASAGVGAALAKRCSAPNYLRECREGP
ncbi:MAG: hypothetical protein GC159_06770 [Phycisphaera sp.]|nr:hypothetical protein [Phycisphaera sp.]